MKRKYSICIIIIIALFLILLTVFSIRSLLLDGSSLNKPVINYTDHSLESVLEYKNPYMGNASNLANMFNRLPLNGFGVTFELKSDELTANVIYNTPISEMDGEYIRSNLVYNSIAAFALIDNLMMLKYRFSDDSFEVSREDVEMLFERDLPSLLNLQIWDAEVKENVETKAFFGIIKD